MPTLNPLTKGYSLGAMVVLFASMKVQEGKVEKALEACQTVREPSLKETGCIRYNYYQQPEEPDVIVFFEEWESREILDAHFREPHFLAFAAQVPDLTLGAPSIRIYEVNGFDDI